MDITELTSYIRKCANKNLNSPVKIDDNFELFTLAFNLVINKSRKEIKVLINFREDQSKHPMLKVLNQKVVIDNVIDFLKIDGAKMFIFTNEQKKIRESVFFKGTSEYGSALRLKGIPAIIYKKGIKKYLDIIIGDSNSVIIGTCQEIEPSYLVNFGDESAYLTLNSFFGKLEKAIKLSEANNG